MNPEELQTDLCSLISSIIGKPVTHTTTRLNEPAWDSLKHMEIIFSIESKWRLTFSENEMGAINSVDAFEKLILSKNNAT
jgi:acyl carrier protein